jgi:transposase
MDFKRRYGSTQLVLLWDGLPAHKAKTVERYIESNKNWLRVYRFPAYAPELNPQEYLWSAVKRADMGNYCPSTFGALSGRVYRALAKRKRASAFLKGCLKASGLFSVKELGEG